MTDSSGLKLTHITFYNRATGAITETRALASGKSVSPVGALKYSSQLSTMSETCTPVLMKNPGAVVVDASGDVWVVDTGNDQVENRDRVQQYKITEEGLEKPVEYISEFGSIGSGNGQFNEPDGIALDKEGHIWVADPGNNRIQKLNMKLPGPHADQTIYYTKAANQTYAACGEHPEWANLPCQTQPALQPTKGNPLPVVTDTYNIWDEPKMATEEFGSVKRIKKLTYDVAGRALTIEETAASSADAAVPKVTDEYSSETGVLIKQSTAVGETIKVIKASMTPSAALMNTRTPTATRRSTLTLAQ